MITRPRRDRLDQIVACLARAGQVGVPRAQRPLVDRVVVGRGTAGTPGQVQIARAEDDRIFYRPFVSLIRDAKHAEIFFKLTFCIRVTESPFIKSVSTILFRGILYRSVHILTSIKIISCSTILLNAASPQ